MINPSPCSLSPTSALKTREKTREAVRPEFALVLAFPRNRRRPLAVVLAARGSSGGVVNNIVARIQGTATTKAALLSCRYDSVVEGPGASNDAHAIAALLESARALLNGPHYATTSSCCSPMAKSR